MKALSIERRCDWPERGQPTPTQFQRRRVYRRYRIRRGITFSFENEIADKRQKIQQVRQRDDHPKKHLGEVASH